MMPQPYQSPFDDVAEHAQAAAMRRFALPQALHLRRNPACAGAIEISGCAVSVIALKNIRSRARAPGCACTRGNGVKQCHRGQRIVDIGWRRVDGQRQARRVYDHMTLAAIFPAVSGIGARVLPPKTARTDWLSTMARSTVTFC